MILLETNQLLHYRSGTSLAFYINSEALTQIHFFKHYPIHHDFMNKMQGRHNTKHPSA